MPIEAPTQDPMINTINPMTIKLISNTVIFTGVGTGGSSVATGSSSVGSGCSSVASGRGFEVNEGKVL